MTSNHGEYSIDVTFENLKRSVEIYWGCTYLAEKVTKELQATVFMHWEFCLPVLLSAVSSYNWKEKSINLIMTFVHFTLKTRITNRS